MAHRLKLGRDNKTPNGIAKATEEIIAINTAGKRGYLFRAFFRIHFSIWKAVLWGQENVNKTLVESETQQN